MRHFPIRGIEKPISILGLGTMMFGAWGNPDRNECRRIADIALESGINFFDTADIYDRGNCEEIVGEVIQGRRDQVVLATKVGNPMSDDPSERGLSARWIKASCAASMKRMGVDHIDLYQMHRPDPSTPILESIAAMNDLIDAGKISAYGTSTFTPVQLREAFAVANDNGLIPPATEQPPYSVFCRAIEHEVAPLCREHGVGLVTWAPLNGGWLTGKYAQAPEADSRAVRESDHFDYADARARETKGIAVSRLQSVADGLGCSLTHLALRFVVSNPAVASCLLGPRTVSQAQDLCATASDPLTADVLSAIDQIVAPGVTINPRDNG